MKNGHTLCALEDENLAKREMGGEEWEWNVMEVGLKKQEDLRWTEVK